MNINNANQKNLQTNRFILLFIISCFSGLYHSNLFAVEENEFVFPESSYSPVETYTGWGANRVYYEDFSHAVLSICSVYEESLATTNPTGIFICPISPPEIQTLTNEYKILWARAELYFPLGSSRAGQVWWGTPFTVEQIGETLPRCPTTHPTGIDTTNDGEIDLCIKQTSCPDTSTTSLEDKIAFKPNSLDKQGNPISCSSGQKIQTDSIYAGGGADPLSYTTHYASPKYDKESDSLALWSGNTFGKQRSDNHSRKLTLIYDSGSYKIYRITYKSDFSHIFHGPDSGSDNITLQSNYQRSGNLLLASDGSFNQTTPEGTQYSFNSSGLLTNRVLANGKTRIYTYTATGKLETVTNHYGQQLQYFYNVDDYLEKLIDPDNKEYFFEYDLNGNLTKTIFPDDTPTDPSDNPSLIYLFENAVFPNNLTGKINEKGVRLATWNYDANGRAISSEHAVGLEKVELDYSVPDLTRVTHHVSETLTSEVLYHYTSKLIDGSTVKQLDKYEQLACTDCVVGSWLYEYDSNGYVNKSTNPTGITSTFVNDTNGLETERIEALGTLDERTSSTVWDSTTRRVSSITVDNLTTEYFYDSFGQPASTTLTDLVSSETRTVSTDYVAGGLLNTVDGARIDLNDSTSFAYDANGNLSTSTNPLGHTTTLENYDASGRVGKFTDANGTVTTVTYTPRGWLESSTNGGALSQYEYYLTGSLKKITPPNGQIIHYEYDDGERLVAIADSLGNRIEYTRDLMGNVTTTNIRDINNILRSTQTSVFNALGQLSQALGNNGQSNEVSYDAEGNVVSDTNALNNTATTSFDAINRVQKTIDPDLGETNYTYNSQDLITSITDAENQSTLYEYNAFGDLTKLTSPDTGITTFTYDEAGNILTKTNARAITVTYSYDALNRLLTQSYVDTSENITYNYDDNTAGNKGIGHLTSVTDSTGTATYFYNAFGQVTIETQIIAGQTYTTQYHYDTSGQLTGTTYPSGRRLDYAFDSLGRVSSLTSTYQGETKTLASNLTYLPFGPMTGFNYGNGKVLTQSFDLDYRLTDKSITGLNQLSYGYDLTNNITSITGALDNNNDRSYGYDKLSRLLTATDSIGSFGFTYDKIGNRLTKTENGILDDYYYEANSHRLEDITGGNPNSFTYDAIGNTLSKGAQTFSYNQQGRLKTANSAGYASDYGYSYKGERVSKLLNGTTTHYIYDLQGQLISEANDQGSIVREYVYLNGQRLAFITQTNSSPLPPAVDFNLAPIESYGGSQDKGGTVTIEDAGATVRIVGNAWKKITLPYTVTADTIIEFDFSSSAQGEIHGIGFDTDNGISSNRTFKLYGTQSWGNLAFNNYNGSGNLTHYQIPVGQYYTGSMNYLFFTNDHDVSNATAEGVFSNIRIYEANAAPSSTEGVFYLHTDHLDTPTAVSDESGDIQWKARVSPFGKAVIEINNLESNIRFPGQYFDSETGLHYNYFRDYDPEIGRYIQSDPIGLAGGMNTYGYVGGNPVNWVDPEGLVRWRGTVWFNDFSIPKVKHLGGQSARFQLFSDCVNGKRAFVIVKADGVGSGFGVGSTGDTVDFNDNLDSLQPDALEGLYHNLSMSISIGGGYGQNTTRLGEAIMSSSGWIGGVGIGVSSITGRSYLDTVQLIDCGCGD